MARNESFRNTQQSARPGCPLVYYRQADGPGVWQRGYALVCAMGGGVEAKAREKATARPRALTGRDLAHDRIEEGLLTCTEPEGRVAVGWASRRVGGWVGGRRRRAAGRACGAGGAALDAPVALVDRLHLRSVHSVGNGLRQLQPARRQPQREPQPLRAEWRCGDDHGQTVERRSTRPDVREPAWGAHDQACCTEQRPLAAARGKLLGVRLGVRGRRGTT